MDAAATLSFHAAAPPIVTTSTWVACERCEKWRRLPPGVPAPAEEVEW